MKSLKLYVASSFDLVPELQTTQVCLERDGHTVPDIWWNVRTKDDFTDKSNLEFYGSTLVQSIAARHWETIRECDAVILVSDPYKERSFTGANVEIGFAHALGKPIFSVGKLKRSAMYVPIIKCETLGELLQAINCLGQIQR